ncbi:formimidoylglutamate deiminase [Caenimonas aquaedulcis]|uniref:Formimidoylglutamate deiminase n=1 Tax=Caenimonas aquaedulcis TaxID=2793270 RepID=A0A931MFF9_9BURK|nr:formimidoylglutamate deiminase [Caenimonas aquaedulcis]MBG9387258.1 formimidoylglutamate deiminase [Caenimonas aquaedulcis]
MSVEPRRFFAASAWIGGAWLKDVVLAVGPDGRWAAVEPDAPASAREGAVHLAGPVLPGLVNGHSHAFQRAMAGLAERSGGSADNFWSWRDRMYTLAHRMNPQRLEAVAAFLYEELLHAGYTQVCEFHYLHHASLAPGADPLDMAMALVRAARRTGIGLTLLPTLYMRSGFGAAGLRDDQQPFASTPASVLRIAKEVRAAAPDALVTSAVAVHSLRAVGAPALAELVAGAAEDMPLHIHIAEQQQEVDDCQIQLGRRPIEWLAANVRLDSRWNLVHATHAAPDELDAVRHRGASIVLCPSTEANLGDGVFDLPGWLGRSGSWSIGSDSHVTRSWQEELRLAEYSQRLVHRKRNIAAQASLSDSSAAALFEGALQGGAAAAGVPLGGIVPGQRADFMVVDARAPALAGVDAEHVLDAMVFSSPEVPLAQVFVAGRAAPPRDPAIAAAYASALRG